MDGVYRTTVRSRAVGLDLDCSTMSAGVRGVTIVGSARRLDLVVPDAAPSSLDAAGVPDGAVLYLRRVDEPVLGLLRSDVVERR